MFTLHISTSFTFSPALQEALGLSVSLRLCYDVAGKSRKAGLSVYFLSLVSPGTKKMLR